METCNTHSCNSLNLHIRLQFDYKGRTSTLQTSSDIAAWIKERKKRFPTKARAAEIAEAGRKCEYLHRAAPQARKDTVEKEWSNARVTQSEKTGTENSVDEERDRAIDAAAKAKRKVEKLRKQLEKEEKRVAKAEAKVSKDGATDDVREAKKEASAQGNFDRIRKRSEREECGNTKVEDASFGKLDLQKISIGAAINGDTVFQSKDELSEASFDELAHTFTPENSQQSMVAVPDPLTTTSQPPAPDEDLDPAAALHSGGTPSQMRLSTEPVSRRSDALTTASLDPSSPNSSIACSSAGISSTVSENDTSSSCSSSETASENVAPDSASSKRNGPEKVAPPKRRKPNQRQKQICREFLKNGRCRRGENCVYRHELPERGSRNVGIKEPSMLAGKKERVGLYQRVSDAAKIEYSVIQH